MIIDKQCFDNLVIGVEGITGISSSPELEEAVATVILHAPAEMGTFELTYVTQRVGKMLANKIAYGKLKEIDEARKAKEELKQADTKTEVPAGGTPNI